LFLRASRSNFCGGRARDSGGLLVMVLVVLSVFSVVTELVVDDVSVLRDFLALITGKLAGLKRYFWGVFG